MELLKHIVLLFISPLNLVILLFAIGMILSKYKLFAGKVFKLLSLFSFFLFTQPYFSDLLLYPLEHKHKYPRTQSQNNNPDYILVLACYYSTLGDVPATSRWSECSLQRNTEAFKLHTISGAPIVITGGNFLHDPNVNYSEKAREFFLQLGVDEEKLIITKSGFNTREEINSATPYLMHSKTWVVSSATHIYRLKRIFSSLNYEGVFFPVDHHTKGLLMPYISMPSAYALVKTELAFYEYAAIVKQKMAYALTH
ncbi:YdcF family protein [Alteromonas sp.]|uniref:YdcF family protein n=1 Tax=Alteromonas sp. TaxID=232 RepID=UPI000B730751|nr:YdcF family protein [Alteromonas sp.]MAI36595.1 hypothetical protein [Alteromonas sp.]OUX90816.1 MAG: hypothetical protein CBB95_03310 [Alteromonas sp. TMED35]|tara:strand:- start:1114 stop:1875 length:762 start_codon:yes stop_codon:yes gene_type:complete